MLSRTADNLYWIARYVERAETMARLLEVGARIAMLPSSGQGYRSEWESLLQASGTAHGFDRKYGDPVQRNIESYMFFDLDNPSSVASCLISARENAPDRAHRDDHAGLGCDQHRLSGTAPA